MALPPRFNDPTTTEAALLEEMRALSRSAAFGAIPERGRDHMSAARCAAEELHERVLDDMLGRRCQNPLSSAAHLVAEELQQRVLDDMLGRQKDPTRIADREMAWKQREVNLHLERIYAQPRHVAPSWPTPEFQTPAHVQRIVNLRFHEAFNKLEEAEVVARLNLKGGDSPISCDCNPCNASVFKTQKSLNGETSLLTITFICDDCDKMSERRRWKELLEAERGLTLVKG